MNNYIGQPNFGNNTGWICPRCNKVNAPWIPQCFCNYTTLPQGPMCCSSGNTDADGNIDDLS